MEIEEVKMVGLTNIEQKQLDLLKSEILNLPSGSAEYPRVLLGKYNQQPYSRVVRRLVEEVNAGVERTIKLQRPKADVWKFYWINRNKSDKDCD